MINYLVCDIDGTMTDGGIYYDECGNEFKKFCTKDGTGIVLARTAGIIPIILTGRECAATTRRMKELGVTELYQGIKDKVLWLKTWISQNSVQVSEIGYIGDDINDLGPMKICGWIGCPSDACVEVKDIADYVSVIAGGRGAVRDCIEYILKEDGRWEDSINKAYGAGI